ncbi:MAG: hypothetical protein DBX47_00250 [Clostridiales bacterium]|nr:MAG: hypothetical protein DBX47_00250 [Clostridiales bacterium]
MKRFILLTLIGFIMFSGFGCAQSKEVFNSDYSKKYDFYDKAVSLFQSSAKITSEEADRLFGLLIEKGMAEEPASFCRMTDKNKESYYSLTSGFDVYKVYFKEGSVENIIKQTNISDEQIKNSEPEVAINDENKEAENDASENISSDSNNSQEKADTAKETEEIKPKTPDSPKTSETAETPKESVKSPEPENTNNKSSITLISLTSPIACGKTASLKIKGIPGTTYTISVFYSSGASKANGLEAKTADSDGFVTWTWKIGAKTKAGNHRVVISGGNDKLETKIETT